MSVHFMSMSVDWATPDAVFDELDREFLFDCDPCILGGGMYFADPDLEQQDYGKGRNGLTNMWGDRTFVNPPYGREIGLWTARAVEMWKCSKTVVMLVPSRTDTIWWHRDIMQADEIRFIKGRLRFGSATNSAPFPGAVVVFRALPC